MANKQDSKLKQGQQTQQASGKYQDKQGQFGNKNPQDQQRGSEGFNKPQHNPSQKGATPNKPQQGGQWGKKDSIGREDLNQKPGKNRNE